MRIRRACALLTAACTVALLVVQSPAWAAGPRTAATCTGTWQLQSVPPVGPGGDELRSVATISSTDAWAVGDSFDTRGQARSLILHWDGAGWTQVSSPDPSTKVNILNDVAGSSSSDVWAVGYFTSGSGEGVLHTLTLHWDGTSWTQVTSPDGGANGNQLSGVASTATATWAVGSDLGTSGSNETLILRWNGSSWIRTQSPNPGPQFNELATVTAISGTLAWAAGDETFGGSAAPLIERWDGTRWRVANVSHSSTFYGSLGSIAATSPTTVIAVGGAGSRYVGGPLVETPQVSVWKSSTAPSPPGTKSSFSSLSWSSPTTAWAVGQSSSSGQAPLFEQWDGSTWTIVSSPTVPGVAGMNSVSAQDGVAFASGFERDRQGDLLPLMEEYC